MPADERDQPTEREQPLSARVGRTASFARADSTRLLSSLYASFTTTYLTLTSIIQGVALAYLVVVVDEELHSFQLANWILVVTTFLVIVSAWHEYMTAVMVFVWIPRLRDSLIPFLLGGSELMLIGSLRRETELEWFFLAISLVTLVTLAAFMNMYMSAAAEGDKNTPLLTEMRSYKWLTLAFVAVSGILFSSFSAAEARAAVSTPLDIGLSAASLALVLAFLARGSLYWNRVIEVARRNASRARADHSERSVPNPRTDCP